MEKHQPLEMDESPALISGTVHSLQLHSLLVPDSTPDTTFQRQPNGGKKPYSYTVDDTSIALVNEEGVVKALRSGKVTVQVTDAAGQSKSYLVHIPNGEKFFFFGSGPLSSLSYQAHQEGVLLANLEDLRILHQRFGRQWPLNGGRFWSTTGSSEEAEPLPPYPIETGDYYYTKDMNSGLEQTHDSGNAFNAMGR